MKNRQQPSWGSIVNDAEVSKVASQQLSKLLMDREKKAEQAREDRLERVVNDYLSFAVTRHITDICEFRDKYPIQCQELITAIAAQYRYELDSDDISNAFADLTLGFTSDKTQASVRLERAIQEAQWEAYWEKAQDLLDIENRWKGGRWAYEEELADGLIMKKNNKWVISKEVA